MKAARFLVVLAMVGCTRDHSPGDTRESFQVGQTVIVSDVAPETTHAMVYGEHFTGGFATIPEGSHVVYLGEATDDNNPDEPLSRISIPDGELKGVVCAIPTSSLHPLPPAP